MSTQTELQFLHRFVPATDAKTVPLLLLHGTGGDENDLLDFGRMVAPGSALLSPRGKVLENGMPRFFKRLAEGVFDEADVCLRANELADFVQVAQREYDIGKPVAVGFSNGANIAAAMLALRSDALAGAVLLRAMVPLTDAAKGDLSGVSVLILSGALDPIIPASNAATLAQRLEAQGATVEHRTLPAGHNLSQADVTLTKAFIDELNTTRNAR